METNKRKIAIIGGSEGQLPLVLKAKEMGFYTIVFSWPQGVVCDKYADKYYPVSIFEFEKIAEICRHEGVEAITSNRADTAALAVCKIAEILNLPSAHSDVIESVLDKGKLRELTKDVPGLSIPWTYTIELSNLDYIDQIDTPKEYPCIVKPCTASGKIGVSYCNTIDEYFDAIKNAAKKSSHILVEQFIKGFEISVETISFGGKHYVLQITDKENTGAPHFVEISQHQPANLNKEVQIKVQRVIKDILNTVKYDHALAHTEFKIDGNNIYLIEINPRGGGCFISDVLVEKSTGYDLLESVICMAFNSFKEPKELNTQRYSGIYWLTGNMPQRTEPLRKSLNKPWVVRYSIGQNFDHVFTTNVGRDSYVIYCSDHKITDNDCL